MAAKMSWCGMDGETAGMGWIYMGEAPFVKKRGIQWIDVALGLMER
jgi:hypothetical protein